LHTLSTGKERKKNFFSAGARPQQRSGCSEQPEQLYWLAPGAAARTKKYPASAGSGNENVTGYIFCPIIGLLIDK